jgi:hypothetical protein
MRSIKRSRFRVRSRMMIVNIEYTPHVNGIIKFGYISIIEEQFLDAQCNILTPCPARGPLPFLPYKSGIFFSALFRSYSILDRYIFLQHINKPAAKQIQMKTHKNIGIKLKTLRIRLVITHCIYCVPSTSLELHI